MKTITFILALVVIALALSTLISEEPSVKKITLGAPADDIATLRADSVLNGAIDTALTEIASNQSKYIATSGKYYQGLTTHSIPPTYGQTVLPDKLASKPHYQSKNWTDFGQKTNALPFAIKINQMLYPDGSFGYQVVFTVSLNNERYSKAIGTGLQAAQFTHDWQKDEKPY